MSWYWQERVKVCSLFQFIFVKTKSKHWSISLPMPSQTFLFVTLSFHSNSMWHQLLSLLDLYLAILVNEITQYPTLLVSFPLFNLWFCLWMCCQWRLEMGKESQASAMEIEDPKLNTSDQTTPKFSINGSCSDLFFCCFSAVSLFAY